MVTDHVRHSRTLVLRMCRATREAMSRDPPTPFSGTVEVDETYVAGAWRNRRKAERMWGTKRGRGTSKLPVFGIYERDRGVVWAWEVGDVKGRTLQAIISATVKPGATVNSDEFHSYEGLPKLGYPHVTVQHSLSEYARGGVTTNGIEGFWGLLKRRLRSAGGIRKERLASYVMEEAWRYNHRKTEETENVRCLFQLLTGVGEPKDGRAPKSTKP